MASFDMKSVLMGCILVDLMSMGRIELRDRPGKLWGTHYDIIVHDGSAPTGHPACDLALSTLVKNKTSANDNHNDDSDSQTSNQTVAGWLHHHYLTSGKFVDAVLESLIQRGVVKEVRSGKSSLSSATYPLINGRFEKELIERLQAAIFPSRSNKQTDVTSNTVAVLMMCRLADGFYFGHFLLRHAFQADEMEQVKERSTRLAEELARQQGQKSGRAMGPGSTLNSL